MQWWGWLIAVVVVLVLIVLGILWIQARRRSGGVVVSGRGKDRGRQ